LNVRILRAYADGPLAPGELETALGWAPQSSLRAAAANLRKFGALRSAEDSPGSSSAGGVSLTPAGRDLLPVADALEAWLGRAPGGSVPIEDDAARGIVRVLAAGWDSTIVQILAEQPLNLGDLSARISDLSYPALKRRLAQLRLTDLVAPGSDRDGPPYEPTDWLRQAIVPLAVAGRWERRHDHRAQPISKVEVEAALLLALPLVRLPARASGSCTCAVLFGRSRASVTAGIERGAVVSLDVHPSASPETWALGSVDAWLEATIDGRGDQLRVGGAKPRLAAGVVGGLHGPFAEALEQPD
jgi:DNA-binding HxlR family transcriptional regulator